MTLSMEKWGPGAPVRGSDPFLSNCHDHVTASVVRIDIVGDDADSEVPCTAHGASLAAGYVEVVREYEFDAFYPDIPAGRSAVCGQSDCLHPAGMLFSGTVDLRQYDAEGGPPVRADVLDGQIQLDNAPGRFQIDISEIDLSRILASADSKVYRCRTGLRRHHSPAVDFDARVWESDGIALVI